MSRQETRGFLTIALAKVWFVITGYAIHFSLPRILATPEAFGNFSTVLSTASILNNVLIAATILTVSRFTSLYPDAYRSTLRQAIRLQAVVGITLGASLFVAAPSIAGIWLRDPRLTPLLRTVSVVVAAYAIYAAFVGSLNGRRRFGSQARLDAVFSTIRMLGVLGGAVVAIRLTGFSGELGAISGFAFAAVAILLVAALTVGVPTGSVASGETATPLRAWLAFLGPLALYQLFLNGILLGDVLILKGQGAMLAEHSGLSVTEAAAAASSQVGIYSAAQKFAFVPYQLMTAMTFVVFPMITRATAANDQALTERTLREALRAAGLLLMCAAAPISGAAEGLLRMAFPAGYEAGAPALEILVFGAAGFALFVVTATAHSGAGRPGTAAWLSALGLGAVVCLNILFLRQTGWQGEVLRAAGLATSLGMGLALTVSTWILVRRFGSVLRWRTVLRGGMASLAAFITARAFPTHQAAWAVTALLAGAAVYLLVLVVSRELRKEDLHVLRQLR